METTYNTEDVKNISGARIAILHARWHAEITVNMVMACGEVLHKAGVEDLEVHQVPGALELPYCAQVLVKESRNTKNDLDAIICFGALLKGETLHFEMVSQSCFDGLTRVSLDYDIPVINEVIPCFSISQLKNRSGNDKANKGYEAALAATEIIHWRRELRKKEN